VPRVLMIVYEEQELAAARLASSTGAAEDNARMEIVERRVEVRILRRK
jgi:hypothetical protein